MIDARCTLASILLVITVAAVAGVTGTSDSANAAAVNTSQGGPTQYCI